MMTDYYSQFKPAEDSDIAVFAGTVQSLRKQVKRVEKTVEDERNNRERLEARIRGLKGQAGQSLTCGKNSFEQFRTSLTKLNRELDTSNAIITSLADEILPKLTDELTLSGTNLNIKLGVLVVNSRPVADEKINELLRACLNERQDFLDSFAKIYSDFGVDLVLNNESYCPGPWTANEVHYLTARLKMSEPAAPAKPQETPQIVEAEPQASEPVLDSPSQTLETAEPVVGPEPEPAQGTTVLTEVCDAP